MNRGLRFTLAISLLIAVLLASPLTFTAKAAVTGFTFKSSLGDGVLTVENDFYVFKLNMTRGAGVFEWSVKVDGTPLDLVKSEPFPLSMMIHAVVEGRSPSTFTLNVEGKNYTIDYPGSLAYYEWNASIIKNETDILIVSLTPSAKALQDLSPIKLNIIIIFRPWTPVVEYTISFTNTAGSPLAVTGSNGTVDVMLVVDDGAPNAWRFAVGKPSGHEYSVSEYNESFRLEERPDAVIVYRVSGERPTFAVAVKPVDTYPVEVEGFKGFKAGNYTKPTSVITLIKYKSFRIEGGSTYNITLNVGYMEFSPLQGSLMDITPYMLSIDPNITEDIKLGIGYVREIKRMNNTIQSLRDRVENLQKTVEDQQKKIEECRGCEDYWKTEMKVLQTRLQTIQERLQRASLYQVALFIIGAIIGLLGGVYAFRER